MSYCDKWALVGLMLGWAPVLLAFVVGTWGARWPRRYIVALMLNALLFMAAFGALRYGSLILWNGLRPAICNNAR